MSTAFKKGDIKKEDQNHNLYKKKQIKVQVKDEYKDSSSDGSSKAERKEDPCSYKYYKDLIFKPTKSNRSSKTLVAGEGKRPAYSYVALIAIVLNESKEKQLTLREIYTAIMNKWPFYREASAFKWQNSIRHNLSLNNCFEKIAKQGSANKKGSYWTLSSGCKVDEMFEEGKYERRKRRRSSSRAYGHFSHYMIRYPNSRHTNFPGSIYSSPNFPYPVSPGLSASSSAGLLNTGYTHSAASYTLPAEEYCSNSAITATSASTVAASSSFMPYQPSPNLLTAQITDYTSAMQYYNNPAADCTQSALPAVHVDNKYQNIAEYDQSLHLNCSVYHTPFGFSSYYPCGEQTAVSSDWLPTEASSGDMSRIEQHGMTSPAEINTILEHKEGYSVQESYSTWERLEDEEKVYFDYSWH